MNPYSRCQCHHEQGFMIMLGELRFKTQLHQETVFQNTAHQGSLTGRVLKHGFLVQLHQETVFQNTVHQGSLVIITNPIQPW